MAHARWIKTCQQCLKTIRVDIIQQECEGECVELIQNATAYCPICHKTTNQEANLIHVINDPNEEGFGYDIVETDDDPYVN